MKKDGRRKEVGGRQEEEGGLKREHLSFAKSIFFIIGSKT